MGKKHFIFSIKIIAVLILGVLLPCKISWSCGPVIVDERTYSLLDTALYNHASPLSPFLFNFESYYKQYKKSVTKQVNTNLDEWRERFCNLVPKKDIHEVIYKATLEQMKKIRRAVAHKGASLPLGFERNRFALYLRETKCLETADYLVFAKRCEPYVIKRGNSWELTEKNIQAMTDLIEEGLEMFEEFKSHYIRLRIVYQLVRLAHYSENYERVLKLHDLLLPKIDPDPSIMDYWILGHKAGALQHLDRNAESAYLFSKIFRECPEKRRSAYLSFKITTTEEWEDCYRLCENNIERASLYAMRAHAENGKAVAEMEKIYALDPHSEELETLLCKEIVELQKDFLGASFNPRPHKPRKNAAKYLIDLKAMVARFVEEKEVIHLPIWMVTDAFLELLSGDYYAAEKSLDEARKFVKDEALLEQLEVIGVALKIEQLEDLDHEDEEEIGRYMREDAFKHRKDFNDFLFDKLSAVYAASGQKGKAFLAQHGMEKKFFNPDMDRLDMLLEVASKNDLNRLEKRLLEIQHKGDVRSLLLEMKGALFLAERQPEAALKVWNQILPTQRQQFNFDPYYDGINDCVHCKPASDTLIYTRADLVEEMLQLEFDSRADLNIGAKYFYKLGLAWYNISYYGNAWQVLDFYRSGSNWGRDRWNKRGDDVYYHWEAPDGNREFKNLIEAADLFEKARLLARSPELAARATFMGAKCEHITYFNSDDCTYVYNRKRMPRIPDSYQSHFEILHREYRDTKFYTRVIKECKYFNAFVKRSLD